MCGIFLSKLSVDGHLGCFHVLAIVNSDAVNIGVHLFELKFCLFVFFNLFIYFIFFGCAGSSFLCEGFL